jgi:hypothetical protein
MVTSMRIPTQPEQERKDKVRLAARRLLVEQRPRRRHSIEIGSMAMEQLDHRDVGTPQRQRDDRDVQAMAARVHIGTTIEKRTDSSDVTGLHSVLQLERRQRSHHPTMAHPHRRRNRETSTERDAS